jgi:hypothetical protein
MTGYAILSRPKEPKIMLKVSSLLLVVLAASAALGRQGVADAAAKNQTAAQAKKKPAQTLPADAPTREEVLKLFDIMQITKTMDAAIGAAKQQTREMAEQMVSERIPEATPEQKQQIKEMLDDVMAKALGPQAIKEMMDATIPVYQKHMKKADLEAMVGFYSSPAGQRILREQPAMVQESMQVASGIQQKMARTMYQRIDQRIEEIAHSGSDTKKP